jgi:transcriptional regulator with XRE-family HTH domain
MQMPRKEIERFRENVAARCTGHGDKVRLAEEAKISAVFLSKIINGHSEPSYETALKIAEALGVPLSELSAPPKKIRQTA